MPSITPKFISRNCTFMNQMYKPTYFVVHFTGGTPNLQSLYNYWVSQCGIGSNSHFGIERVSTPQSQPGDIWQFVQLYDGACANCCVEAGSAPFLPAGNMNTRTISVECINPNSGNLGAMPQAQFDSLVYLIKTVCQQLNIPTNIYSEYYNGYENTHTWANQNGGVIMHRDIAPINRRMCPGDPYYNGQMDAIMKQVNGGSMASIFIPPDFNGWYIKHWQAFFEYTGQLAMCPPRESGIFNFWKNNLLRTQNIDIGPVMSAETSAGGNWVEQEFGGGTIFWNTDHYEVHVTTGGGPQSS